MKTIEVFDPYAGLGRLVRPCAKVMTYVPRAER